MVQEGRRTSWVAGDEHVKSGLSKAPSNPKYMYFSRGLGTRPTQSLGRILAGLVGGCRYMFSVCTWSILAEDQATQTRNEANSFRIPSDNI